jgi:SNF family Na+-dependent transporter
MNIQSSDFTGSMFFILGLSFFTISYFMGMMIHSALMYEDKKNIGKDSRIGWVLSMVAGAGITGWMFYYGYYVNFVR